MTIGYLIHRFPVLSETFISREIAALDALGADIRLYSFVPPNETDAALLTPEARALMKRTVYISSADAAFSLLSPKVAGMLGRNRRLSRDETVKAHPIVRLGRASNLLGRLRRDRVSHLHAHWPYGTEIAHLIEGVSDITYSVSVHAHEVAHEYGHFEAVFETLKFASFCNAAAMNYLLPRLSPAARQKARLYYHGIELEKFSFSDDLPRGGTLRLVSAGRMTATKGFTRLLEFVAKACGDGFDIELTILGRGATDELTALASQLGIAERVKLPGWVPHSQVPAYIHAHHAFVLLSDTGYNEGLPNVVLEAMACGRPVIVTPFSAVAEAVKSGETGFVLREADDYSGFVAALRILADRAKAANLGAAARRMIEDNFDASVHIRRLLAELKVWEKA